MRHNTLSTREISTIYKHTGSYRITTIPVFISPWMGARLLKLVADINHYLQN